MLHRLVEGVSTNFSMNEDFYLHWISKYNEYPVIGSKFSTICSGAFLLWHHFNYQKKTSQTQRNTQIGWDSIHDEKLFYWLGQMPETRLFWPTIRGGSLESSKWLLLVFCPTFLGGGKALWMMVLPQKWMTLEWWEQSQVVGTLSRLLF